MRLKQLAILFLVIGLALLGYSFTMPAYTNQEAYDQAYMALYDSLQKRESHDQYELATNAFFELRDRYLTIKYRLQDYAVNFFVCSASCFFIFKKGGRSFSTPRTKLRIILVGCAAAGLTAILSFATLLLDYDRGEAPGWADSMGIPFAGLTAMTPVLFLWAGLHCLFLRRNHFATSAPLLSLRSYRLNYWCLFLAGITALLCLIVLIAGAPSLLSGLFWVYFYLSLAPRDKEPQPAV